MGESGLGHHHTDARVAKDVGHLVGGEESVDGHEPQAREDRGEVGLEHLDPVVAQQGEVVTGVETDISQRSAEAGGPVVQLAPGAGGAEVVAQCGRGGVDLDQLGGHRLMFRWSTSATARSGG